MNREPYNGLPPFVAGVDTSEAAAQSVAGDAGQLREFIFDVIKGSGGGGMTCDEVEVDTGMRHQTASARIRELQQRARVVDSSRRRPTRSGRLAIVWVVLPPEEKPASTSSETGATAGVVNQSSLFAPNVIDPLGEEGLAPLRKRCFECTKCELSKGRVHVVFGEGNSDGPDICFVGEAPSGQEDETGHPFVGPAGAKLTKIIEAMGYRRDEIYVCNAVNCRPPGNRPPEKAEVEACHEFLLGQIRAVRPKVLIALGASAVKAMTKTRRELKISEIRGKWVEWQGIPLMPTYHPSFILRLENQDPRTAQGIKKLVWSDMQMVLTKLGRKKSD